MCFALCIMYYEHINLPHDPLLSPFLSPDPVPSNPLFYFKVFYF